MSGADMNAQERVEGRGAGKGSGGLGKGSCLPVQTGRLQKQQQNVSNLSQFNKKTKQKKGLGGVSRFERTLVAGLPRNEARPPLNLRESAPRSVPAVACLCAFRTAIYVAV